MRAAGKELSPISSLPVPHRYMQCDRNASARPLRLQRSSTAGVTADRSNVKIPRTRIKEAFFTAT
jgi:hypothetical protein